MKIFKKISEIIFPNHCLSCEEIINKEGIFCSECWLKLQFITEPKCAVCSYPFEFQGLNLLCGKCLNKKPSFEKAIAIFRYNHVLRRIISSLKYRDQTFVAKKFSSFLFKASKTEIKNCDVLTIVPLHISRLRKRKFNQSALLAKSLIEFAPEKTLLLDLLIRTKNTKPQVELRKKERENNLKNVFELNKKYQDFIRDKKIVLIDDVFTTGATLENCAKVLKKYKAKEVVVLTIAKTAFTN